MTRSSLLEAALLSYGIHFPDHTRKWWLHAKLRKWAGVAPNREVEVLRRGIRWLLNPADFAHDGLFWLGTKDTWDIYHLRRLVKAGDVILDVGANFGYYALSLAKALDGRCVVHALEPDPANFDRLRRHIERNGLEDCVRAHRLGVSDRAGTANLNRHPGNSGHSALVPDGEVQGVTLTTLDAFCRERELARLDVLILDVEGYEERALKGAAGTLGRFKPLVVVELFPPVMNRQGSNPEAAARILTGLGYQLFAARRDRLEPLTTMPTADHGVNAFGFHPENPRFSPRAGGSSSE
jgi:FkbM family methyltransferase